MCTCGELRRLDSDICTCFLSWEESVLEKASIFQAATVHGPAGALGCLDEQDREVLHAFVAEKKCQESEQSSQQVTPLSIYHPLLNGEIRILELYPAKPGSLLQGDLHVASIDFAYPSRQLWPSNNNVTYRSNNNLTYQRNSNHAVVLATGEPMWYTALSYTWGAPVFDQTIHLRHGNLKITSSLASALHHLRTTEHSVFLWIDQICINQTDRQEKEQQIPLMGLIYTHATNTVIWLGDGEDFDPTLAFDVMETVYSRLQMTDGDITPNDFERLFFPPALDRSWWEIRQFLRTPWFSRLWTIQEAILSRKLYVKWGKAEADWEDIAAWCFQLQESGVLKWLVENNALDCEYPTTSVAKSRTPSAGSVIISLQSERLHFKTHGPTHLMGILVSTRYADATNLKDKIYGVLGMAITDILPDYSDDVTSREIYHQASLSTLHMNLLESLSCVDHEVPLQPSWVPDWSMPRVTETLGYFTKTWALYDAGGKFKNGERFYNKLSYKVDVSEDKKRITLSGKIVDSIATLGCVSQNPILGIDEPRTENQEWASYIKLITPKYQEKGYPKPKISIYDAFWQTLLAGRDGSGTASPSAEHSEVFSLILDSTTGMMPSMPGQSYSPRRQEGHFTLNNLRTRKPAKILEDLRIAFRAALKMRRFAITSKGYFALVPRGAQEGDEIVVFDKGAVPFVVRKTMSTVDGNVGYELLGEAYVHGIMQGEVIKMHDIDFDDVMLV
ncbi:HET-domain-containing protein [Dothidotthia symphoricarpi CBS 119687]|uniref:HET-domain-containing protein n=1 Tax=Dothidotthia symphoricarpi CBS 119687 TaxID=1392245 RepID=A0A6A6AM76_9PLEO|nr:HET-domain-containing protein [Dothidotthia symphoricarpi CBS 119687]KAF2132034.1 HET-domain-containing protein [Dothidotthia symphoricarpi CBS 119687]